MNFYLEFSVGLIIVGVFLFLSKKVIPNNKNVRIFIIKNKNILHPDKISYARLLSGIPLIGLYLYGVFAEINWIIYISIWIFVLMAITDLLDGVIARECKIGSKDGAKIDALADKWFDLPALLALSFLPVTEPIYITMVIFIIIFDIIGQKLRGKYSPPEANKVGKAKTTVKFSVVYLMTINGRYQEIYDFFYLDTVITLTLFIAVILTMLSMFMKTSIYNYCFKKAA
jgi:phosphatidylglycerophosphate synthase